MSLPVIDSTIEIQYEICELSALESKLSNSNFAASASSLYSGGTIDLLTESITCDSQAQYCVEMDACAFNAASLNLNGRLKLDEPLSLAQFIKGRGLAETSSCFGHTWVEHKAFTTT